MFDRFGREVTYLRISVTDRCNLRCTYCMPEEGMDFIPHERILSYESIAHVARAAASLGFRKIRLTGGEPTVRKGLPDLVAMLAEIPGIEQLAMTTNGALLPRLAAPLRKAGLDSVNISLDTLDPDQFRAVTLRGRIEDTLLGIDEAVAVGFSPIKINMVVAPETTEQEIEQMREFAESKGATLQLIAHYRLDVAKHDGYRFDRPPNCAKCNRLRLTSEGSLKPCLHSNIEVPVDLGNPEASIREAVRLKPASGTGCTNRSMMSIGG